MPLGYNKLLTWNVLVVATAVFHYVPAASACRFQPDTSVQCQSIDSLTCQSSVHGLHFNSTSFPNLYGHRSQGEVASFLDQTNLLLLERLDCSWHTRILICSALYPLCYPGLFQRVEPCRELCLAVREGCADRLSETNQQWPEALDCERFAPYGSRICIWNQTSSCMPSIEPSASDTSRPATATPRPSGSRRKACVGRVSLLNNSRARFGGLEECVEPCRGVYFEQDQDRVLVVWMAAVSFLSLVLSILTFFTYLLNYKTVPSLEVPIYYIALCYGCVGLAHLISVAVGREGVTCDPVARNSYNQSLLLYEGLSSPACFTLFSLTYYFTICTWSWWLVLTLQWTLSAFRSTTQTTRFWGFLRHLLAWTLPLPFLVVALFGGRFSGDPVIQTCWVHKGDRLALLVLPLAAIILICSPLVLVSFARVVKLQRTKFKSDASAGNNSSDGGRTESSLDPSLLVRVGNYLAFYLLPMGILFGTYFYDHWFRVAWEDAYLTCPPDSTSLQSCEALPTGAKPSVEVYMTGVFVSLCMGFLSVLWLLRQRLFLAWKNICCMACMYGAKRYDFRPKTTTTTTTNSSSSSSSSSSRTPPPTQIGIHMQSSTESQV